MAVFGDYSTKFQREAHIPGSLRVETGCITAIVAGSVAIPTKMSRVVSLIMNMDATGGTTLSVPVVASNGTIQATTPTNIDAVVNYVAFGF